MASISFSTNATKQAAKMGSQLMNLMGPFINNLQQESVAFGLHIETIRNAIDSRIRSARMNRKYRALVFELNGSAGKHYLIEGFYNHDDAYKRAPNIRLEINPVTGVTSILEEAAAEDAIARLAAQKRAEANGQSWTAERSAEQDSRSKAEEAARDALELADQQSSELKQESHATQGAGGTEAAGELQGTGEPAENGAPEEAGTPEEKQPLITASREDIIKGLGLSAELVNAALAITDESFLPILTEGQPEWISQALLGLSAGLSVSEIREELELEDHGVESGHVRKDADTTDDDQLIRGLKTKAAEMEYLTVEEGDETAQAALRQAIESGDFNNWRIFLHPTQQRIVEMNYSGSGRVQGGAGTGKTVVAVHRVNRLALESTPKGESVLLTTFTRVLAEDLKSLVNILNEHRQSPLLADEIGEPGLYISGIDSSVSAVLAKASAGALATAGEKVLGTPLRERPKAKPDDSAFWKLAVEIAGEDLPDTKLTTEFLSAEYQMVILAGGITSESAYKRVPRRGRGTPLSRGERGSVWRIIENYKRQCAREGEYSFATLAALAAEVAQVDYPDGLFRHVVIDEAQDFHPGHWRFIRAIVPKAANDIFLAEDAHQRIYGHRLILSHFGINTVGGASRKLRLNYRTTRENLNFAVRILEGRDDVADETTQWIDSTGEEDSTHGYRSARSGPAPVLKEFSNEGEELEFLANTIEQWQREADESGTALHVGILMRTRDWVKRVADELAKRGIEISRRLSAGARSGGGNAVTAGAISAPQVEAMTMHSAKGMEFTHVIIAGLTDDRMPLRFALSKLGDAERVDALQRERALLFVAASRARDQLVLTWSGEKSEMLPGGAS